MRIKQTNFTADLREQIVELERKCEDLSKVLNEKYKPIFAGKQEEFEIDVIREGQDPFTPYYISEISFGVEDDVVYRIVIWECERLILGLPFKWALPGSKVIGELLDETYDDLVAELEENIEYYLEED